MLTRMGRWLGKRKCWRQRKADMEVGGATASLPDGAWHYQQQLQQGRLTSGARGSGYPPVGCHPGEGQGLRQEVKQGRETTQPISDQICLQQARGRLRWQWLARVSNLVSLTLS